MSKIKATIVVTEQEVASQFKRTPVVTRVQDQNQKYRFVNKMEEVKSLLSDGNYSVFVNRIRGKDNNAPFEKGQLCSNYKEALEYIASNSTEKYRVDLVLRNREYSADELEAIASNLDF